MYKARGFNINVIHRYNTFNINYLIDHIRTVILNLCAKGQHIPSIESSIQTINQGSRCTTHSMPYNRYANLMTSYLVECIIHSFPQKVSIINILGSNTILLGKPSPDFNMNRIFFASHTMVYTGTTNALNIIRTPSISIRESNEYEVKFFMLLYTGK